MIFVIDNYDSFTYNLVHYCQELGADVSVYRNDTISPEKVLSAKPNGVIISPGPCTPNEAGISLKLVQAAKEARLPLLGVCLGHQCIGQSFGGHVVRAPALMHGKTSLIEHDGTGVFEGIQSPYEATRYHSLIVDEATLPGMLRVNARTQDGIIMGFVHKTAPLHGVQFHPESIATHFGHELLANFLRIAGLTPVLPQHLKNKRDAA